MYQKRLTNPFNNRSTIIEGKTPSAVMTKCQRQINAWGREEAQSRTIKANRNFEHVTHLIQELHHEIVGIDWDSKLDHSEFTPNEREPQLAGFQRTHLDFWNLGKYRQAERKEWQTAVDRYNTKIKAEREAFLAKQKAHNSKIETRRTAFLNGDEEIVAAALREYLIGILPNGISIDTIGRIIYDSSEHVLAAEVILPDVHNILAVESYRWDTAKQQIIAKQMSDKKLRDYYDNIVYQILVLAIYALHVASPEAVQIIAINGVADVTDKATGITSRKTVASVQLERSKLQDINFAEIDVKEFFRHFNGVSAGRLVELVPIKPLVQIDRHDNRIIEAENVLDNLDESRNLAAMPWEEFEVLVRDLMQKEFSHDGAEVHVTQASRDNGVDAIAYDPDPIRGGKFVIQAKRYNILVPVSAVRDLYGTVMHEGARSGIIITTSHFGPEAREFAKNKPLTLINGNQLLGMFQKYGYNFSIELDRRHRDHHRDQ